jgi:hypothetical protein
MPLGSHAVAGARRHRSASLVQANWSASDAAFGPYLYHLRASTLEAVALGRASTLLPVNDSTAAAVNVTALGFGAGETLVLELRATSRFQLASAWSAASQLLLVVPASSPLLTATGER